MEAKELKKYILADEKRLETILSQFGFQYFWITGDELRCAPPESENKTACSVRLTDNLYASLYSKTVPYHGDLLGLLETVSDMSFKEVIAKAHHALGLEATYVQKKRKRDLLNDLRQFKQQSKRELQPNKKKDVNVLDKFIRLPHEQLLREGIAPTIAKRFDICFDPRQSRIIFPHFDWEETDKIVGITGRTTVTSDEAKALDIPKYWNYIKGYKKTQNLYGYAQMRDNIREHKKLVIFESEKSVLKLDTLERGNGFGVSVGGHEISSMQMDFILSNSLIDTEIIIAFDKDVLFDKDGFDGVLETCERFARYRPTSYIKDRDDFPILGEKDSPIDRGIKTWRYLYEWRVKVGKT